MHVPILLVATDYEGDVREIPLSNIEDAIDLAMDCSNGPFAWLDWEIWGNHPETWKWMPLAMTRLPAVLAPSDPKNP